MKELSFLEMLNQYPVAGALALGMLVVVLQIIKLWKGKSDATRIETETNKLARQTSETVNRCASRTQETIDRIDRLLEAGNFGHIHAQLDAAVSMLEALAKFQSMAEGPLVRIDRLVGDIVSTLERNDSRVVHSDIIAKITHLQSVVDDVKRITIQLGNS